MVLVPWDRDQPGVAFRAAQVGTAEVVAREALTEERLVAAIAKVLETPSYRQEAGRFAERLQARDAVGTACDLIEECLDAAG
jgi:UDP:flavonoid glycosyltransferase YjiC (YdhE family)